MKITRLRILRRTNLRSVVLSTSTRKAITKRMGWRNRSPLTQMVGPNPIRQITDKMARRLEHALCLPMFWLDNKHPPTTSPTVVRGLEKKFARLFD